jgi:hypothetical protein
LRGLFFWGRDVELEGVGEGDCSGRDRRGRECRGCSGNGARDCEWNAGELDGAAADERGGGGVECGGLSEEESAAGR